MRYAPDRGSPNSNLHHDTPDGLNNHKKADALRGIRLLSPSEPSPLCGPANGDDRVRTDDPLLAKQVLSQLSYAPLSGAPIMRDQPTYSQLHLT